VRRLGVAVALLLALPLLIGARDPRGDVMACTPGSVDGSTPDLVAVEATAQELGTAAVWRLTFARPLVVPDPGSPPMRIDILVRDPKLPSMSVGDERGLNRIVRWDATSVDQPIIIKWIPEHSQTSFNPPVIEGDTVEIRAPGRILLGESANGTESVRRLRWSVLVSDGGRCDRLGAKPALRLATATSSPTVAPEPTTSADRPGSSGSRPRIFIVGGGIILGLLALWGIRRFGPR
jgi:hypothetical protein